MLETKFHTHTQKGNIIVLYTLIFMFLDSTQEDGRFWTECAQAFPEFLRLAVAKNFHTKCDFTSVKTLKNNLTHNTNKFTHIKTYILTYLREFTSQAYMKHRYIIINKHP